MASINRRNKPTLIVFSGIDGCGKTTQIEMLSQYLSARGIVAKYVWNKYKPWLTAIPFKTIRHFKLRNLPDYTTHSLTKKKLLNNSHFSHMVLYSVLLDCLLQTFVKVKIPLSAGRTVICDRYFYDTLVDLSLDLTYPYDKTIKILNWFVKLIPRPDALFIFELPPEIAFARKDDIPSLSYIEDRQILYRKLARDLDAIVIDGGKHRDDISVELQSYIDGIARVD